MNKHHPLYHRHTLLSLGMLCALLGLLLLLTGPAGASTLPPSPPFTSSAPPLPLEAGVGSLLRVPLLAPSPGLCATPAAGLPAIQLQLSGFTTGLTPVGCDSSSSQPAVTFHLSPETAGSNQAADHGWQMILRNPWRDHRQDFVRTFSLTLHAADGSQLQTAHTLRLQLVTPARLGFGLLLIAITWALLFHFGRHSSMLRDSNSSARDLARPYSLSRVQMAWWFGLVFTAYVFIWVMTWDWVPITATTLSLLGISGATGLVATGIDQPGGGKPRIVAGSSGFFRDILTDVHGITLARLQLLIWNASLGGLFLAQVLANLRIPELDPSTLALLGLSASAYVGFKVPEQQGASPAVSDPTVPTMPPAPTAATLATPPAMADSSEGNRHSPPPLPADDPKQAYSV